MVGFKKCMGCNETQELNSKNFRWRNDRNSFVVPCKKCISNYNKNYRKNNKNKIKEYNKKYFKIYTKLNSEKIKLYKWQYYIINKHNIRKKQNISQNFRRKNNISVRIRDSISSTIYYALKKRKNKQSILKYLSYTIMELKQYIEKQFKEPGNEWMTWENWGVYNTKTWDDNDKSTWTWQIDHIKPHSDFKYETMDCQEFRDCWALSNLRPYSAKKNFIDGVNRTRHKIKHGRLL